MWCWAAPPRRRRRSLSPLPWPSLNLPGLLLGLELVQRRPDGGRAHPLGAAVHVLGAAAPHYPVFARADPDEADATPHVPLLLPPTPRVTGRHAGQLLGRQHRALH